MFNCAGRTALSVLPIKNVHDGWPSVDTLDSWREMSAAMLLARCIHALLSVFLTISQRLVDRQLM